MSLKFCIIHSFLERLDHSNLGCTDYSAQNRGGYREFQIDNDSEESVHTGLETLTHLIRNRKLLLSAHKSH